MPNWTSNIIRVKGSSIEQVAEFLVFVRGGKRLFDFDRIIPMPELLRHSHTQDGVWEWATQHWGTKWNTYDVSVSIAERGIKNTRVEIRFDTAWSAPLPIFRAIAAKFPQLVFEFRWTDEFDDFLHSLSEEENADGQE
jgi:hypothetical protein